jgi:hypothetical protein
LGIEYPSYPSRQKIQILLFKSKWDTLSVLHIENETHFGPKNRGAAPLKEIQSSNSLLCKHVSIHLDLQVYPMRVGYSVKPFI